jgi:ABC-type oligopeptide transport system substrate-binding subunit
MIGTFFQNRYRLDAELGHGGMGTVYRSHDTLLDRDVAVKVLSDAGLGTEGRARLLREAQSVAKLNHPNIVAVHDAGEVDSIPFVVMEWVEGSSLRECLPTSLEDTLAIVQQLCAALDHAHTHGIVHRDLKPENVMVLDPHPPPLSLPVSARRRDGWPGGRGEQGVRVKLMDFGLARTFDSRLTSEGVIVGTVSYLAPEQALGQAIDGRTDLYALGVLLYELSAGRLPFTGDDPIAVISQHLYAPVVPPSTYNSAISPALDTLIMQLLSKQIEDRPASATVVSQALKQLGQEQLRSDSSSTAVRTIAEPVSLLARIARGRFVARQSELGEAQRLWQQAVQGEGHVLLISGEPGVGKTRLARELLARAKISSATVLTGECFAEGSAPYAPLAQVVQMALTLTPALSLWERETPLPSPDGRGAGGEGEIPVSILADLITIAPALRATYPDVPPNLLLEPQAERQRIFDNVAAFFALLSERAPVLIFIDDAHWADSGTLFLLHHLARRVRDRRVLIVLTYREVELGEARPFHEMLLDLNRERLATRLKLARFDREQTCDLLAALFQEAITPEFLDGIYGETDGNPFFVEEVCKALIESGKLRRESGQWKRPGMDQIEVPQSVRVAIELRIAKLPAPTQDTLRAAAILGREFEFEVLRAMDGLGEEALIDALEIAERAQLIGEIKRSGATSFAFVHALIPLTLHEGLSALRRQRLHRRAAQAIEQVHAAQLSSGDFAAALGRHYAEAGDVEKSIEQYTQAAERARSVYAYSTAIDHYQHVLYLLKEQGPTELTHAARTAMTLGGLYHTVFDFERAQQAYQEGFALWQRVEEEQRKVTLPSAPHALRLMWTSVESLDITVTNYVNNCIVIAHLFSGLVEYTPDLDIVPDLARSWEILDGGRRYVFHLRPEARWSDGRPVTAHDFEFSWKHLLEPVNASPNRELLYDIKDARAYSEGRAQPDEVGVHAIDDLTLIVELEEPVGHFLHLLSGVGLFAIPRHAVEACGPHWADAANIVTNGPFRLETWQPGEHLVLVRNPAFHGRATGNVLQIEFTLAWTASKNWEAYEADDCDVCGFPADKVDQARQQHANEYHETPIASTTFVNFNLRIPPFNDVRVRRAFAHAIDHVKFCEEVMHGMAFPATGGFVPPCLPGHSAGIGLPYDPARARQLLAEAGYADGRGLALEAWSPDSSEFLKRVQYLTQQWHDILGVDIHWTFMEWREWLEKQQEPTTHLFESGWIADYPDLSNFLEAAVSLHTRHWDNADYDQLLVTARHMTDLNERIKIYQAAERILIREAVIVPIYYGQNYGLTKPWVKRFWTLRGWWSGKDVIIEPH